MLAQAKKGQAPLAEAIARARAIPIRSGADAAERVRERLAALVAVRREAGNVGRTGSAAEVGRAAADAAALYADTARDIGRADPPKDLDPIVYGAYREQADRWVTSLHAEADGAWQSCVERGEPATSAACARQLGTAGKPAAVPPPDAGAAAEKEALSAYLAQRRRELSACWGLLPAGASASVPKRVAATVDLRDGRATAVDFEGGDSVSAALRQCISAKVYLWKFPVGGEVQLELPFEVIWKD